MTERKRTFAGGVQDIHTRQLPLPGIDVDLSDRVEPAATTPRTLLEAIHAVSSASREIAIDGTPPLKEIRSIGDMDGPMTEIGGYDDPRAQVERIRRARRTWGTR